MILLYTIGSNIVSAVNTYYYTYVLGNLSWSAILTLVMCITIFPATMIVTKFIGKYGKKKMYAIGLAIAGLTPLMRLIDVRSIPILIISALITGIGSGFAAPLNYGIQADNTDYIEMKMGIRVEGAVASLSSFISKCAMGIGGAIPGYMLQVAGFNATAEVQTQNVINVIIFCLIILPAIINGVGIIIFAKGYPLTKEKLAEQTRILQERHSADKAE